MPRKCRPPIAIDEVLEDPSVFEPLIERHAPYYPVQRYFESEAEQRATSGKGPLFIAPNFRGDWAYDQPLVEGAELFLEHEGFLAAARALFDTEHVRPQQVYTNLTWQLPFPQGGGHTDVPAFRGIDRTRQPVWLLGVMGHSGLFEDVRREIATCVAWFYQGEDGGFEYWPDGPDQPSKVHQGDTYNTAIMGDNDRMFHRIMPVGERAHGILQGMSLKTRLEPTGTGAWRVAEDEVLAEFPWSKLRISVSWKGEVFRDDAERRLVDEHADDIDLDEVFRRFETDLARRGLPSQPPADPLRDADWIELLRETYVTEPATAR